MSYMKLDVIVSVSRDLVEGCITYRLSYREVSRDRAP